MIWVIQRLLSLRSHAPVGVAQLWIVERHRASHQILWQTEKARLAVHIASTTHFVQSSGAVFMVLRCPPTRLATTIRFAWILLSRKSRRCSLGCRDSWRA